MGAKEKVKKQTITVRLPLELCEKLEEMAKERHISVPTLIPLLITWGYRIEHRMDQLFFRR